MITTIGAGPAGCFYASKEKKDDVTIIEEHKSIGKPVSCTGILTSSIKDIIRIPNKTIVTKIKKFKIISPNGEYIYVNLKNPDFVVNREKFDKHISELALDNGAKIKLNEKFIDYKKVSRNNYIVKTSKENINSSMIVGADGPRSGVAQSAGIYGNRKFVIGYQARCKYPDLEKNVTTVFLNQGEFSWIVPEDDKIARVGIIGKNWKETKCIYEKMIGKNKVLENQSGIVPIFNPKQKIQVKNEQIYLIGDAATHVKATTYGGILYGLLDAKFLAENKISYQKCVKQKIGNELWLSLKIREMMNSMGEKQANTLIEIFQKQSNNDIISKHDRNYPSKFILELMLKEPRLWGLGLNILKNRILMTKN